MIKKQSAGILLFRKSTHGTEVFLGHPGGPFWKNKDTGSWSIPKGEFTDEPPLNAAIREFAEETGTSLSGDFIPLTPIRIKSGKIVYAWALEFDLDESTITSNTFDLEWPPKSGVITPFPEIDKAAWFPIDEALGRINVMQQSFINELVIYLDTR